MSEKTKGYLITAAIALAAVGIAYRVAPARKLLTGAQV